MSTTRNCPRTIEKLAQRPWPPTVSFAHRLAGFRRVMQAQIDRLPKDLRNPYAPRIKATARLALRELAMILPPVERHLLEHIQARRPLDELIGQAGFPNVRRRNRLLQRLFSRVQKYVGSQARHRLAQVYDRRGHLHSRRPRRPRRLLPSSSLPSLEIGGCRRTSHRHRLQV